MIDTLMENNIFKRKKGKLYFLVEIIRDSKT